MVPPSVHTQETMEPSGSKESVPSRVTGSAPESSSSVTVWSGPAFAVGGWFASTTRSTVTLLGDPKAPGAVNVSVPTWEPGPSPAEETWARMTALPPSWRLPEVWEAESHAASLETCQVMMPTPTLAIVMDRVAVAPPRGSAKSRDVGWTASDGEADSSRIGGDSLTLLAASTSISSSPA